MRVLSGKSNGGEHVHDQVDPEELHNGKWRVVQNQCREDDKEEAGQVHSHLEGHELADVVLNVASPPDGVNNGKEVVVHQNDVGVVLGSSAAIFTHGESNVGLADCAGIRKTLASDSNDGTSSAKSASELVLDGGVGSVDEENFALHASVPVSEALLAVLVSEVVSETATLGIVMGLSQKFVESSLELLARDHVALVLNVVVLREKTELDGSNHGGVLVVARHDAHVGLSFVQLSVGLSNVFAHRVSKTHCSEVDERVLEDVNAVSLFLHIDAVNLAHQFLVAFDISVGNGEGLESIVVLNAIAGVTSDHIVGNDAEKLVLFVLGHVIDFTLSIDLEATLAEDDLRGALNNDTALVLVVLHAPHSRHALAVRAEGDLGHQFVVGLSWEFTLALGKLVLHSLASADEPLEEADLDGASNWHEIVLEVHLHVCVAVQNDALLQVVQYFEVGLNVIGTEHIVADLDAGDVHVTSGEGGSLSGKDIDNLTGGLESIKVLNEKSLLLELVNRESHSHGDDKWHTFGDADDEEGKGGRGKLDGSLEGPAADELFSPDAALDEPDDAEEDNGDHGDPVGVDTDELGQNAELVLERSQLVLNGERVVRSVSGLDFLLLEGVLADSQNDSLAGARHDNGVLEQDRVGVVLNVRLDILVRALLGSQLRVLNIGVVVLFVNFHIHLFDEVAVGGDAVTLLKKDDVANDEVLDEDGLGSAVVASKDSDFLSHDLLTQSQELSLFAPVTEGLNEASEEDGDEDRDTLNPLVGVLISLEEGDDERGGSEAHQDNDVDLVELVKEDGPEGSDGREGSLVCSEAN